MTSGPGACRQDPAARLAEADASPVGARGGGGDDHLVAVLEEGPFLPADLDGLRSAPGQLDEGTAGLLLRPGDRAGRVDVTRAGRCAVDGQVREHLGR